MKLSRKARIIGSILAVGTVSLAGSIAIHIVTSPSPGSPEAYLARADEMAFNNNWMGAAPFYRRAESGFRARKDSARILYAEVSQVPATMESRPLPDLIAETKLLLKQPGAEDQVAQVALAGGAGAADRSATR